MQFSEARRRETAADRVLTVVLVVIMALAMMPLTAGLVHAEPVTSDGWITFTSPAVSAVKTEGDTEYYQVEEALPAGTDPVVISFSVSGQQKFHVAQLQDENGNPAADGTLEETTTGDRTKTITLTGLAAGSSYRILWPKLAANNKNPQSNIVLSFTTAASDQPVAGEKADNTLTAAAKKVTLKASKLKKAKQTVAASKYLAVKKAQGTVTYQKTSGKANFKIDKKTGKLTVKKGTKKGSYNLTVKVTAAGNDSYKAGTKTVKVKVVVKK